MRKTCVFKSIMLTFRNLITCRPKNWQSRILSTDLPTALGCSRSYPAPLMLDNSHICSLFIHHQESTNQSSTPLLITFSDLITRIAPNIPDSLMSALQSSNNTSHCPQPLSSGIKGSSVLLVVLIFYIQNFTCLLSFRMLKTPTLLGKALFMHANMDILLLVNQLLSVAVIYSGKLERDIARVCLTDSCFEIQLHC